MGSLEDMRSVMRAAGAVTPPGSEGTQRAAAAAQRGTAIVLALRDTGMAVDGDPVVELDLEVTLDGGVAYAVTHRQSIPRLAVAGFQPGASVPVRVDPGDPGSLVVG